MIKVDYPGGLPEPDYKNFEWFYPKEPSRFNKNDLSDLLLYCSAIGSSDITIQNESPIICHIHGKLFKVTKRVISKTEVSDWITFVHGNEGAIGILNSSKPIDASYEVKPDHQRGLRIRFRVNVTSALISGHRGYQITFRTIPDQPPLISEMNLPQDIIDNICPKQGLILITGATGSGKSTLLSSIIRSIAENPTAHKKILTFEAPVEFVYDDINKPTCSISQSEIGPGKSLETFADGVRNALRRAPNIALIGEMRDHETISEGVILAMTGHLVYSTVHSNGFADTIRRMVNVFNADEKNAIAVDIINSLKMVITQLLVPSVDNKRVALREYLIFNEEIVDRLLMTEVDKLIYTSREVLKQYGQTFLQDAEKKFAEGVIDEKQLKEIRRISVNK